MLHITSPFIIRLKPDYSIELYFEEPIITKNTKYTFAAIRERELELKSEVERVVEFYILLIYKVLYDKILYSQSKGETYDKRS